ncbi:hypothetical protein PYCC9005_001964 [Savitreella phatthalungensis]
MYRIPRSLTYAQKQRLTNSLFWTVALSTVVVVALPSILPCPARQTRPAGFAFYTESKDGEQESTDAKVDKRKVIVKQSSAD